MGSASRLNGRSELKSNASGSLSIGNDDIAKSSLTRLSISQNSDHMKETKCSGRLSTSQNSDLNKESKSIACMLLVALIISSYDLFIALITALYPALLLLKFPSVYLG